MFFDYDNVLLIAFSVYVACQRYQDMHACIHIPHNNLFFRNIYIIVYAFYLAIIFNYDKIESIYTSCMRFTCSGSVTQNLLINNYLCFFSIIR